MSQLKPPHTPATKQNETAWLPVLHEDTAESSRASPESSGDHLSQRHPGSWSTAPRRFAASRGSRPSLRKQAGHGAISHAPGHHFVYAIAAQSVHPGNIVNQERLRPQKKTMTSRHSPILHQLPPLTGGVLNPSTAPLPDLCAAHHSDWLTSRLRFTVPASAPLTGLGNPCLCHPRLLDSHQSLQLFVVEPGMPTMRVALALGLCRTPCGGSR
jgi:hypothetical protein